MQQPPLRQALDAAGETREPQLGEAEHAVFARVRAGRHRGPQHRRERRLGGGERRAHAACDHLGQVGQPALIEQWVDATPVRAVDGEEKDGTARRRHARRGGLDAGSRAGRAIPPGGYQREAGRSGRARNDQQERDGNALPTREVRGEPREEESDTAGGEHRAQQREQALRRLLLDAVRSAHRNARPRSAERFRSRRQRGAQRSLPPSSGARLIIGATPARASRAALERDRQQPDAGEGRRVDGDQPRGEDRQIAVPLRDVDAVGAGRHGGEGRARAGDGPAGGSRQPWSEACQLATRRSFRARRSYTRRRRRTQTSQSAASVSAAVVRR